MLELAIEQLIVTVKVFVQLWARDEVISGQGRAMTPLADAPSPSEKHLCIDKK